MSEPSTSFVKKSPMEVSGNDLIDLIAELRPNYFVNRMDLIGIAKYRVHFIENNCCKVVDNSQTFRQDELL